MRMCAECAFSSESMESNGEIESSFTCPWSQKLFLPPGPAPESEPYTLLSSAVLLPNNWEEGLSTPNLSLL